MRKLETTTDLLDALMERHGWTSDNQVAIGLGVPQTTVSSWRRGRTFPTEVHALKIADALEIPPLLVIAIASAERSDDETAQQRWSKIARQLARGGAAALAALVVATAHYSPVETCSAVERQLCYILRALKFELNSRPRVGTQTTHTKDEANSDCWWTRRNLRRPHRAVTGINYMRALKRG